MIDEDDEDDDDEDEDDDDDDDEDDEDDDSDDDDDDKTREQKLKRRQIKEKLKQYELIYNNIGKDYYIFQKPNNFIDISYKKTCNYVKYIQNCNFYHHEIERLKGIIKPKIRNINQANEIIIIEKKSIKNKVNKTIKDYYIDNIEELKEQIKNIKTFKSTQNKPVYNIDNAFTPAFIDFFCKKYGISHYAYDINKTCFMKYVHKNQNHRALCYYAMNNHMYLVKDPELVKSMVEKAKAPEHKIKTSLLEYDELKNYYKDDNDNYKPIYLNITMENVKNNMKKYCNSVCMYSRSIHNINDVFEEFISTFNTFPEIKKCNKTNIMEFHFKPCKGMLIIFCCDPNDINVITYKEIKDLCIVNGVEFKNQTYTGFITNLKIIYLMNYVNE